MKAYIIFTYLLILATLLTSGARHVVTGSSIYLGTDPGDSVSVETNGRDSATASLDTYDDGVTLPSSSWTIFTNASVIVEASDDGWVAGWCLAVQ